MKKPNAFGLYDMLGNVAEWVLDRYYNAYDEEEAEGAVEEPELPSALAVVRGGNLALEARSVRASNRLQAEVEMSEPTIGVRCAVDAL